LVGRQEGHLVAKKLSYYVVDGDLTGAFHVIVFWMLSLPPLYHAISKVRHGFSFWYPNMHLLPETGR